MFDFLQATSRPLICTSRFKESLRCARRESSIIIIQAISFQVNALAHLKFTSLLTSFTSGSLCGVPSPRAHLPSSLSLLLTSEIGFPLNNQGRRNLSVLVREVRRNGGRSQLHIVCFHRLNNLQLFCERRIDSLVTCLHLSSPRGSEILCLCCSTSS